MNTPEFRRECAVTLQNAEQRTKELTAFVGFDGFVDNILHVVDKRESAEKYNRIRTIAKLAERVAGAAGKSTNIELVTQRTKLGGNGPIMANAMVSFGVKVCYLGNVGHPQLHPIFADFARSAEVHSILDPGYTDALEFEDGKIMLGKHGLLKQFTWQLVSERFGEHNLATKLGDARFAAFVNWTHYPGMNEIWGAILSEICPMLNGARRILFFDLADPEKRTPQDIRRALELIAGFQKYFDVILGLNEKESSEIGKVLGLDTSDHSPNGLARLGQEILSFVPVSTLVIHPVAYAVAVSKAGVALAEGPFTESPLITTGAGDHFNAGFCFGKLLDLNDAMSLLIGVSTSGFYVRTAKSPTIEEIVGLLNNWPTR
jgi:sugar/nucleoside kinase (ribokinase family)